MLPEFEQVIADLHDIFAHGLGDVAGVDLQRPAR